MLRTKNCHLLISRGTTARDAAVPDTVVANVQNGIDAEKDGEEFHEELRLINVRQVPASKHSDAPQGATIDRTKASSCNGPRQ